MIDIAALSDSKVFKPFTLCHRELLPKEIETRKFTLTKDGGLHRFFFTLEVRETIPSFQ